MAVAALGAWCVHQHGQITRVQAQLAATDSQLKAVQAQLEEQTAAAEKAASARRKAQLLQDTLNQAAVAAAETSQQVTQLQQSLAASRTNRPDNPLAGMARMFKDPKMKEMIKSSQKMFIGPMIEREYGALFQQLGLTPEQSTALKDLLEKRALLASDAGMSMLGAGQDAAKRTALVKQIKDETDAYNEQIKQLLGENDYQTFKDYEKSVPDRMTVDQFREQVAGTGTGLTADQQQQLIQAMQEERTSFKWTANDNPQNPGEVDFAKMFSSNRLDQYARDKERYDQQMLERARQILSPAQLTAFEKFQTAQREMQITSMKLAAQMFAPKSQ